MELFQSDRDQKRFRSRSHNGIARALNSNSTKISNCAEKRNFPIRHFSTPRPSMMIHGAHKSGFPMFPQCRG